MMEEKLFVNVECSPLKHAVSRFSVRKTVTQKKDRIRVTPGWTDISGPGPLSFLSRSSMDLYLYADSTEPYKTAECR